MRPLDWVILSISIIWILFETVAFVWAVRMYGPSLVTFNKKYFYPWIGILFVIYRLYG